MPKRNSHRMKAGTGPVKKPFLFTLPRDLQEVKLWAFSQGIMNAFHSWSRRPESDDPQFISAAAIEAALLIEKKVVKGKSGSNEPVLFRKTFADLCALIHPAATRLFETQPVTYKTLLGISEEKRVAVSRALAEQYLPAVEHLIEEEEPIVFGM